MTLMKFFFLLDELFEEYSWFRNVFAHEFVFYPGAVDQDFEASLTHGFSLGLLTLEQDKFSLSRNEKLYEFCITFMAPFVPGYLALAETLNKVSKILCSVLLQYCNTTYDMAIVVVMFLFPHPQLFSSLQRDFLLE